MLNHRAFRAALAILITLVATFSTAVLQPALALTTITDCSDHNAIEAQLEAGGDFVFNCGVVTITFDSAIDVSRTTSIDGAGTTTFSGGNVTGMFNVGYGVSLNINRLTVINSGPAMNSAGLVVIANSTFSGNRGSLGGAIRQVDNTLRVSNSTFLNNTANWGGAIFGDGADITIENSTFSGNRTETLNQTGDGGAISFESYWDSPNPQYQTLTLDGVTFTNNRAEGGGGAINIELANVTIMRSTFSDNYAYRGGAIHQERVTFGLPTHMLAISESTFAGNSANIWGGAIYSSSNLSISRSTLSNNSTGSGGALYLTAGTAQVNTPTSATITSTTFSGNRPDSSRPFGAGAAGAIQNGQASAGASGTTLNVVTSTFSGNTDPLVTEGGTTSISSSTFTGNSGKALAGNAGTTTVGNSILAVNAPGVACSGTVASGGHNIVSDGSCAFAGTGDRNSTAANLGPLQNNGGPTLTHAPLAGSPAIDTGSCPGLTVDQRGVGRPQGPACDVGAVEEDAPIPDTSFNNPPAVTGGNAGPFVLASSEPGSTFECQIDGGGFVPCTSPASFPVSVEGQHELQVRAIDQIGNVDPTPASHSWFVDLTAPVTTIVTHPPKYTNIHWEPVTFTFSSIDSGAGVARYECRLDTPVWSACPNPMTYNMTPAMFRSIHDFRARAIDKVGNVEQGVSYLWYIDLTPPETTILTTPELVSSSNAAAFTFTGSDTWPTPAPASFECKLDNGAFSACSSPVDYTNLAGGAHTFQVRAIDLAGNPDESPASYTWTVEANPPDTTILTNPPPVTASTAASFTFSGIDNDGVANFECRLDSAAFSACTSPADLSNLTDGSHTFQVRAIDVTGNADPSPASYTWTVDLTAPDTEITDQPASLSSSASASFSFTGSDANGVASFECSQDGAPFSPCTSPANLSGLSGGSHTFEVRAIDAVGNVDPSPASDTWTVDLTAPETTLTAQPPALSDSASPSFSFTGDDAGGIASFECQFDGGGFVPCTSPEELPGLADGSHTFAVRAIDTVGHADSSPASYTWSIDTTAPGTTITSQPPSPSNSPAPAFSFTGSDASGIASFECQLDGGGFSPCAGPMLFADMDDGEHTFQVRATDLAGNVDPTPASYTWTVDLTSVEVGGVPTTATSTTAGENISVFIDGEGGQLVSVELTDVTFGTSPCCSVQISVRNPDGSLLAGPVDAGTAGGFIDAFELPEGGRYEIFIDPLGNATGSASVAVHDASEVTGKLVIDGPPLTLTLGNPGQNGRGTFSGTAGESVLLELDSVTIGSAPDSGSSLTILNPDGTTLFGTTPLGTAGLEELSLKLTASGIYSILLDPVGSNTGSATFALTSYVPPSITAVINDGPILEGGNATITVIAEPGSAGLPLGYEFDCDDDGSYEIGPQPSNTATCAFGNDGSYTVNVRVTDQADFGVTATTVVEVENAPPAIDDLSISAVAAKLTVTVDATDPSADSLDYSFDCDNNGSYEIGPQAANSGICDYGTRTGQVVINVRVSDGDGGSVSDAVTVFISKLCVNASTGGIRVSTTCNSSDLTVWIPEKAPATLCANRYTGALRFSFSQQCGPADAKLVATGAGTVALCVSHYTGGVRVSPVPGVCSASETVTYF